MRDATDCTAETVPYLGIELEPSVGSEHHDRWRAEGVLCRQQYAEVIQSSLELRAGRPPNSTMPFLRNCECRSVTNWPCYCSQRYHPGSHRSLSQWCWRWNGYPTYLEWCCSVVCTWVIRQLPGFTHNPLDSCKPDQCARGPQRR